MLTMHTIQLSTQEFQDKIFNYSTEKEWKYTGELPAIVDFYADWCAPCRMVAPILEDLAKEYEGRLLIYKVNTEKEPELAAVFGIQSIPSFLFIPVNDEPSLQPGALPKNAFKQVIEEHLLQTSAS
jgi:thioredoxin